MRDSGVKQIGNLWDAAECSFKNRTSGRVYAKTGISPTLNAMQGGQRQPMIIVDDTQGFEDNPRIYKDYAPALRSERAGLKTVETDCGEEKSVQINVLENYSPSGHDASRVTDTDGIVPTIKDNHNTITGIVEKRIVAMRGRNPQNPSDRTPGVKTEQRLEPNMSGICNTLTSVQKDNMVLENICINDRGFANKMPQISDGIMPALRAETHGNLPKIIRENNAGVIHMQEKTVRIKQATKQGYIECEENRVADLSYPDSKTRRGRVQGNGQVSPTLTADNPDICRIEPRYRIRKLTPRECWRLMDFSDEDFDKAAEVNSSSALYSQAGNSIVRNVLVAIMGQLAEGKENEYRKQ